uniref:Reverse transcriptase zinc-binding domain-containing protein n=1 Tax=Cannabis sativa TaxID=3483 RepID=A0A803QM21_CANSA
MDSTWNVHKLKHFFPAYQVESILKIPLDPTFSDSLIWGFHPSGIITVKYAYHLASSLASADVPSSSIPNPYQHWWKKLWSLSVPPKIKNFIWKAFHHILPCALNLFLKRILPHPNCSICGNNAEFVTHALIGFPKAKTIWKSSRFKQFYLVYHQNDIKEFFIQELHNIPKQDFPVFIAFVWHIWNTRNSILFNKSGIPNNVEEFVITYLQEYIAAQCNYQGDQLASEAVPISRTAQQQHPPLLQPDTLSLFVDAALDQNHGLTGTGFIFKLGFQTVLASHCRHLPGAVSPIFVEVQALLESLRWCLDSQLSPKVVFSDCLNLVSKVNSAWQDNSALFGHVSRIRLLFSNFPYASLQYLPRQFNMEAHGLAKEALRQREVSKRGLF